MHWALRDIHFTVQEGEIFGIVGPNGAGKTTLLKTIAGIYKPTQGSIHIHGLLSSFIELDAPFHPDLDGRQNIYLWGAYFELGRSELNRKFDEIVEFSGVGSLIDRKLRSYSAGMIRRLALALTAQLKSTLMIFDDLFGAEDLRFQEKYLQFIEKLRGEGSTIVLTSHNLEFLSRVCQRGLYLDQGKQGRVGDILPVISGYKRRLETSRMLPV